MPQILIKGNHCTLVMRKWSFQHISMPCVNLELKVCFHLTISVWLIWNDHMFFHQYILSWCYRSSYQMNRYLTFVFSRCLCMLCFTCIMLNANKCMPSPLSKWRGEPSHQRHLKTDYMSQWSYIQMTKWPGLGFVLFSVKSGHWNINLPLKF